MKPREVLAHHVVIAMKPVPQGRPRVPRSGKPYYGPTSKNYRKALWAHLVPLRPIHGPVGVSIQIAGAKADSDLDNHCKMVLDALQDAGVIDGDDVRVVREIRLAVIAGPPRTVLWVWSIR